MGGRPLAVAPLLAKAVVRAITRGVPRRLILEQLHELGYRSLLLVAGGMVFFGAVMMAHGASQARKVVQDLSVVGPAYFELVVREFGPTIAGILASVRIAAAISAEIAAMSVTEQIDALEMSAGDRYADLVFPRLVAGLIGLPALIVSGTVAATLSAAVTATLVYSADGRAFMDPTFIDSGDILAFVLKAVGYGLFIPLAACRSGLSARGGPGAVGEATTSGVVAACLWVLAIDLATSGVLFITGY